MHRNTVFVEKPAASGPAWKLIGFQGGSPTVPPLDTTGADLLVVAAATWQELPGVTDNFGNTWILGPNNSNLCSSIYYCRGGTVGPGHQVTLVTPNYPAATFAAYSGSVANPADQSSGSISTSPGQPGAITPMQAGELVLTALCADSPTGISVDSGFNIINTAGTGSNQGGALASLIQAAAATVSPTWTAGSTLRGSSIISFKGA